VISTDMSGAVTTPANRDPHPVAEPAWTGTTAVHRTARAGGWSVPGEPETDTSEPTW